jgi:hypothetical protein
VAVLPHPIPYPGAGYEDNGFAVKITVCVKCHSGLCFSDIILSSCRHVYHPWCACVYFRNSNTCAYDLCKSMAGPEWAKSFGFKEFDADMTAAEVSEGSNEAMKLVLHARKELALAKAPDAGQRTHVETYVRSLVGMCLLLSFFSFAYFRLSLSQLGPAFNNLQFLAVCEYFANTGHVVHG